jgi:RNA polymerase sigma-70 factor, ECF subfamily
VALKDVPSDLVERCQRGDAAAFDELFTMIRDDMFRWIYSMLRDEDETEEVLQECCVRMFRHIARLKESGRFGPWASRMIVNQVNTRRVNTRRTRL